MKFIYAFKGLSYAMSLRYIRQYNIVEYNKAISYLGDGVYSQFSHVFTNVLQAIEENDEEFLKNIMEDKLFRATRNSMQEFSKAGLRFKYIQNQNSEVGVEIDQIDQAEEYFTSFRELMKQAKMNDQQDKSTNIDKFPFSYEETDMKINMDIRGVFGIRIKREENANKQLIKYPQASNVARQYYLNMNDLMATYNDQIVIANVIFKTTRKLVALDETGEIAYGDDDLDIFTYHKWRFESQIPNLDWVLTDIDDHLKGNPYQ